MSYTKPRIIRHNGEWLCYAEGAYGSSPYSPTYAFWQWEWNTGRRFKIPRPVGRFARKRAETRAGSGEVWLDHDGKPVQVVGYICPPLGDKLVVRDWTR